MRSSATIRSRNFCRIWRAPASSSRFTCRPTGPRNAQIEEVEWVQSVADRSGWPHAIVSFVDFQSEDAPQVMAAQAKAPLMRGARQQLHWHTNPQYRFAPTPDQMNTPAVPQKSGAAAGLWLAVRAPGIRLADGGRRALAKAFPDHHVCADACRHAGGSIGDRPARLARRHGAARRSSPICTRNFPVSGPSSTATIRRTSPISSPKRSRLFGPERCVWGSNFPIEKFWTDYASIVSAIRAALKSLPQDHQRAVLHDNAAALYRLN